MEQNELVLLRLSNQYLLRTGERMEVLRAMNGFQAQFLSMRCMPCACAVQRMTQHTRQTAS